MKILLLTNMYPSEQAPNYGVFVQRTENILKNAGHSIILVKLTKTNSKMKKLIGYIRYALSFFMKTHFTKPDVIYVHYASQNAKLIQLMKKWKTSIPIILNTHGTDILPQTKAQEQYQQDVQKMMKVIDQVIVPSSYYQQVVKEKYDISCPITIFPSGGVDTELFQPNDELGNSFRESHNISKDKIVISYISRVDPFKGWDTLLDSISIIKKHNPEIFKRLHILMAGSGSQDHTLNTMVNANELNSSITRLPMLTQKQMVEVFNASDIFCFPSHQESLGLVGLEAMACGIPLLASDIPGTKDYVNEENAITFQAGNLNELADQIIVYANLSETEKKALSRNALHTAKYFDQNLVAKRLKNVFENKNLL